MTISQFHNFPKKFQNIFLFFFSKVWALKKASTDRNGRICGKIVHLFKQTADNGAEGQTQEKENRPPELPEEDTVRPPTTVPNQETNEADVGTDGQGITDSGLPDQKSNSQMQNDEDDATADPSENASATGQTYADAMGQQSTAQTPQARSSEQRQNRSHKRPVNHPEIEKTMGDRNQAYRKRMRISEKQHSVPAEQVGRSSRLINVEHFTT